MVATLRLRSTQRWLDLRELETRESLRRELAATLQALDYRDLDMADVLGRDRRLTRAIARFAQAEGFLGIAYKSRFDYNFDCWAVFEGARFEPVDSVAIASDDPDFVEAMKLLGLRRQATTHSVS